VKKEPGIEIGEPKSMTHPGYISNLLHDSKKEGDVVRVSHPFGDFFLEETEETAGSPVVLISAGVGLTALLSILNTLAEKQSERPITWIHTARNSNVRAFKSHVEQLSAANKNLHTVLFTTDPSEEEVQGQHYDVKGRLDMGKLNAEKLYTDNSSTQYFTCGPTSFMQDVGNKLKSFGVPSERIKMELFGTGGVPRD